MAKAFECDKCKTLTLVATNDDLFYAQGFRIELKYLWGKPGGWYEADICFDCRFKMLEEVLKSLRVKQTLTWKDLEVEGDGDNQNRQSLMGAELSSRR